METLEEDLGGADGIGHGDAPAALLTGATGTPPCRSVVSSCCNIGTAMYRSYEKLIIAFKKLMQLQPSFFNKDVGNWKLTHESSQGVIQSDIRLPQNVVGNS